MLVIHGEDVAASRKFLQTKIDSYDRGTWEAVRLVGKDITLTAIKQTLEGGSLFGNTSLLILEDVTKLSAAPYKEIVTYLSQSHGEIVMWEKKQLTALQVKALKAKEVRDFPLPKLLFSWLDSLGVVSSAQALQGLHDLVETQAAELVFTMFVKRIRQLMILAEGGSAALGEVEKLADWQMRKLSGQIRTIKKELLVKLYEEAWEFDQKRKSGKTGLSVLQWMEMAVGGMRS